MNQPRSYAIGVVKEGKWASCPHHGSHHDWTTKQLWAFLLQLSDKDNFRSERKINKVVFFEDWTTLWYLIEWFHNSLVAPKQIYLRLLLISFSIYLILSTISTTDDSFLPTYLFQKKQKGSYSIMNFVKVNKSQGLKNAIKTLK